MSNNTVSNTYIRCVACDRELRYPETGNGLCPSCDDWIADYDQPYVEIKYCHTRLTGGITQIPPDLYENDEK